VKLRTSHVTRYTSHFSGDAIVFGRSIINQMEDIRASLGNYDVAVHYYDDNNNHYNNYNNHDFHHLLGHHHFPPQVTAPNTIFFTLNSP
jgi:hypothetical protein